MSHVEDEDVDDFLYGDSSNKKGGSIEQNQDSGKFLPKPLGDPARFILQMI